MIIPGRCIIDYAVVIMKDTAYNNVVCFIDFAGPKFHQHLVCVNICGMNIMLAYFLYASRLRSWLEV